MYINYDPYYSPITTILMTTTMHILGICGGKQNNSGIPPLQLRNIEYVCSAATAVLSCCEDCHDRQITWYRQENNSWHRLTSSLKEYNTKFKLQNGGQSLKLFHAKVEDNTTFRCDIGGERIISQLISLIVLDCDAVNQGIHFTAPFPENKIIYDYGENIRLTCTAIRFSKLVLDWCLKWCVEIQGVLLPVSAISSRYSVDDAVCIRNYATSIPMYSHVQQAVLTITDVRKKDTNKPFYCVLAGTSKRKVMIIKKEIENSNFSWFKIGLIIGCSVGIVTMTCIVVLVVWCLYGPQIRLFFNSRMSVLGPKRIDNDQFAYNVFMYHADADARIARLIKHNMIYRKYKIYIAADMKGNQNIIHSFFEKTAKSAVVLFLYSNALRRDDLANFFLQSLITERKGKGIIFLEIAKYDPKDVMNWALNARDVYKVKEGNVRQKEDSFTESQFGYTVSITETAVTGEDVQRIPQKSEIVDDLKFWKVLPRIKIPKETKNKRKMKNFWSSLQNKIPKFADQDEAIDKRVQSLTKRSQRTKSERHGEDQPLMP